MFTTLATTYDAFLADATHLDQLRPHTLRAYRYELAAAANDTRLAGPLATISLADLEAWIARAPASPSTVGRRAATFRRFFAWAVRHELCARDPMAGYPPVRARRRLPRPIREDREQRALAAAIAAAPQPYRLIVTLLRETGMRAGEVLALRVGDVTLDAGREAWRAVSPRTAVNAWSCSARRRRRRRCAGCALTSKRCVEPRRTRSCSARTVGRLYPMMPCTTNGPGSARRPALSMRPAHPAIRCTNSATRAGAS